MERKRPCRRDAEDLISSGDEGEDMKPVPETSLNTTASYGPNAPEETAAPYLRLWCRDCSANATADCVDEHPARLCNLRRARDEEAAPLLEALERGKAALDELGGTLPGDVRKLCADLRRRLEREKGVLAAAWERLQKAVGGVHAAAWEEAKQSAAQALSPRSVAKFVADLADPETTCSVTVHRVADGDSAWCATVRPAEDAAARMMLCGLVSKEELRQLEQQPPEEQQPREERQPPEQKYQPPEQSHAGPEWEERTNDLSLEGLDVERMAAMMRKGSRVARGRDWDSEGDDGIPPGPGTVTAKFPDGFVNVKWERRGNVNGHWMGGPQQQYEVRLLPPRLKPLIVPKAKMEDVHDISFHQNTKPKWKFLANTNFDQVHTLFGLHCELDPLWCQAVLEEVAPHLEGLQMLSPLQRHLDVALKMPHLQALSITGVTGEQLQQVCQVASLRSLELHCPLDAPLPVLALATGPRLERLRCGVYPLAAALALVRAHADSLEELQLVAASTEPYGCPDLAGELRRCGLKKIRRLVLLRQSGYDVFCCHDKESCGIQTKQLRDMFAGDVNLMCSICDATKFQKM